MSDHELNVSMTKALKSPPALWGFAIGLVIGIADNLFFSWLGVEMILAGTNFNLWVGAFFTISFGGFTMMIGALIHHQQNLKQAYLDLNQKKGELAAAERRALEAEKLAAVGRLSAGVAHEVRNPLGVIKSSAMLVLKDMQEDSDHFKATKFIIEEVDRLNRYVQRLLDYTKPLEPAKQTHNLAKVLQDSLALIRLPSSPSIQISTANNAATIDLLIDSDLVIPVILGLVQNSIQALPEGGQIELRAKSETGCIHLEIADSGEGVAEHILPQIFDPFVTTKASGTGLGLAMGRRVIEAHGGKLNYHPNRGTGPNGQGACFSLTFPTN